jgi:hypothetical protein
VRVECSPLLPLREFDLLIEQLDLKYLASTGIPPLIERAWDMTQNKRENGE